MCNYCELYGFDRMSCNFCGIHGDNVYISISIRLSGEKKYPYTTTDMCRKCWERLDRIEAIWQRYKHFDYLLSDKDWLFDESVLNNIFYDLWQAIRREE